MPFHKLVSTQKMNAAKGTIEGTLLSINGRIFGPLELDGASLSAGILAHAEDLELDYGPVQLQEPKQPGERVAVAVKSAN